MTSTLRWLALLTAAVVLPGCLAAAAAAGAGAAIHLSDNSAFGAGLDGRCGPPNGGGARRDGNRGSGAEAAAEWVGVQRHPEGMDVRVELDEGGGNTTLVKASAGKGPVEWDNRYARSIVERIVERS